MDYFRKTLGWCVFNAVVGLTLGMGGVSLSPVLAGNLEPPTDAVTGGGNPAPTMKTLDHIPPTWSQKLRADDGASNGCGSSRFECVLGFQLVQDGPGSFTKDWNAVLDNETGLVWERDPDTATRIWENDADPLNFDARRHCLHRGTGGRMGWRLPSIHELTSLIVPGGTTAGAPDLPPGHPFSNIQNLFYWSATEVSSSNTTVWGVRMDTASVSAVSKVGSVHVWCVRGGGGLSEY